MTLGFSEALYMDLYLVSDLHTRVASLYIGSNGLWLSCEDAVNYWENPALTQQQ